MSINDEFELVPRGALKDLKREIELLKTSQMRNPEGEDLAKNIALLKKSVDAMYDLFKKAAEEIKLEDRDQNLIEKKLEPLTSKIELLTDQNQKIAKALVAISNMVSENMKKFEDAEKNKEEERHEMPNVPQMTSAPPSPPPMNAPMQNLGQQIPAEPMPRPMPQSTQMPQSGFNMPPPPPRRKGFF